MPLAHSLTPNALRVGAFWSGLAVTWLAIASPLAGLDHRWLTAHMVQHLVLTTIAAPLILWGAQQRPEALSWVPRLNPLFCWLAGTGTVIAWHVPALFEIGMRSAAWHSIEGLTFLFSGLLFWWPVVRPKPSFANSRRWAIPLYLFLATLPCDALSAYLAFCDNVVYSHYAHHVSNTSALADQATAGALMWIWVTFAYLAPAAIVTLQILAPQCHTLEAEIH